MRYLELSGYEYFMSKKGGTAEIVLIFVLIVDEGGVFLMENFKRSNRNEES